MMVRQLMIVKSINQSAENLFQCGHVQGLSIMNFGG